MAAITLSPWWGEEMKGGVLGRGCEGVVVVVKGKHSQQKVGGESCGAAHGWGGI